MTSEDTRPGSNWRRIAANAAVALCVAAAIPLSYLSYDNLGSGRQCEGIGFGCTPERFFDAVAVVTTLVAIVLLTVLLRWLLRRRLTDSTYLALTVAGVLLALVATVAQYNSELPYWVFEGPTDERIATAEERLEATLGVIAERVPQLKDAISNLERTDPLLCRDAMDRETSRQRVFWHQSTPPGFEDLTLAQDEFVDAVISQGFEPRAPDGVWQGHVLTRDGYSFDLGPRFAALPSYDSGPVKSPLDADVPEDAYTHTVNWVIMLESPCLSP